jgi:hypothetical protein
VISRISAGLVAVQDTPVCTTRVPPVLMPMCSLPICCHVEQCYSGTEAPCAYGELISIGAIGGEKNKKVRHAAASVACQHGSLTPPLAVDAAVLYFAEADS